MPERKLLSEENRTAVTKAITNHPELSYQQIARRHSVSIWTVYCLARKAGIRRLRGTAAKAYGKENS